MFIEVTEALRCPADHPASQHCVLLPQRLEDRTVVDGVVGCPVCRAEYPITDGLVEFGAPPATPASSTPLPETDALATLLGLETPGGLILTVGSVAQAAAALHGLVEAHVLAVNPPRAMAPHTGVTRMTSDRSSPLRDGTVRGVVASEPCASAPWLGELARVAQPGSHIVVCGSDVEVPDCDPLAAVDGVWVGKRRPVRSGFVSLDHSP